MYFLSFFIISLIILCYFERRNIKTKTQYVTTYNKMKLNSLQFFSTVFLQKVFRATQTSIRKKAISNNVRLGRNTSWEWYGDPDWQSEGWQSILWNIERKNKKFPSRKQSKQCGINHKTNELKYIGEIIQKNSRDTASYKNTKDGSV